MPRQEASVAIQTAETIRLETKLRLEIRGLLSEFAENKQALAELEAEQDRLKSTIDSVCEKYGATGALQSGIKLDGFSVQKFTGQRQSRFNLQKFVRLGGKIDIYNASKVETPKKDFITIRVPGEEEEKRGE